MKQGRTITVAEVYHRNLRHLSWQALGLCAAWPMLGVLKCVYPTFPSRDVMLFPIPFFGLPALGLCLNELAYRGYHWIHRHDPTQAN
jgi:hypothetical protein